MTGLINNFPVSVYVAGNVYVADLAAICMLGTGKTRREAVRDLEQSVIDYYGELKVARDRLEPVPLFDFEYLEPIMSKYEHVGGDDA